MKKRIITLLLVITVLSLPVLAADIPDAGTGDDFYVHDEAGTLSESTRELILDVNGPLEQYCSGAQIVVVTINYLPDGYDSEQYANLLFRSWGVGSETENNGMLLLHVVREDRGWLVQGSGIESQFSTDDINDLLDTVFWPLSDAGEYDEAVARLIPQLVAVYADIYDTDELYAGPNVTFTDAEDYFEQAAEDYRRQQLQSRLVLLAVIVIVLALLFVNSMGRRRRYYRSYGTHLPLFFFCGGPGGPRGPRGPRWPGGPRPPFGGGGGFHGGGFGGGFHGGGFGGGGRPSGGGGGRR